MQWRFQDSRTGLSAKAHAQKGRMTRPRTTQGGMLRVEPAATLTP